LSALFKKLADDLADHQVRAIDEAYFRMRSALEETAGPVRPAKGAEKQVTQVPKANSTVPKLPRNACAGFLGSSIGAVKLDGKPYRCGLGKECGFKHVGGNGKTAEQIFELISAMPKAFHDDLTKAAKKKTATARKNGKYQAVSPQV
jgi:hypothetical protein